MARLFAHRILNMSICLSLICIVQAGRKGEQDSATNLEARGESKIEAPLPDPVEQLAVSSAL